MIAAKGGASEPPNIGLPGKAGGAVAVRRTLACTICRIADPTQVPRPRQLRDVSTVMRFQPAHQSMINRRFNDRASCPARKSPKPALARKPPIHSPASGKGGHESVLAPTDGTGSGRVWPRQPQRIANWASKNSLNGKIGRLIAAPGGTSPTRARRRWTEFEPCNPKG